MWMATRIVTAILLCLFAVSVAGALRFGRGDELRIQGPLDTELMRGHFLAADFLPPAQYIIEPMLVVEQTLRQGTPEAVAYGEQRIEELLNGANGYLDRHRFWAADLSDERDPRIEPHILNLRAEIATGRITPGYEMSACDLNALFPYIERLRKDGTPIDMDLNRHLRQALLEHSHAPAIAFFELVRREFFPALKAGDRQKAEELARGRLAELFAQHRAAIDRAVGLTAVRNIAYERYLHDEIRRAAPARFAGGAVSLGLGALLLAGIALLLFQPLPGRRAPADGPAR